RTGNERCQSRRANACDVRSRRWAAMIDEGLRWGAAALSTAVLIAYELHLRRAARRDPMATSRSAHTVLREEWVEALSRAPGTEVLAVQSLRNAVMSATMNASTAALVLMGSISLLWSKHQN